MSKEKGVITGKIIHDHIVKNWDESDKSTFKDQLKERERRYTEELLKCIEDHKKVYTNDFYIDVQKKTERLFKGKAHRLYFIGKQACPSPTNDQDVFKYYKNSEKLEHVWSVPDMYTCQMMLDDPLGVPKDQRDLLKFIYDFTDGTLLQRAKELNGETKSSPIIMKG